MRLTTNGYKVPETDDTDFWDQLVYDIERLDGHTHDGTDSERVTPGAIDPYSETVEVADWVGASAPYYYDVVFPLSWGLTWADGDPCPVQVCVRDSDENVVHCDQGRATGGLGVRVYSSVKAVYVVGMY